MTNSSNVNKVYITDDLSVIDVKKKVLAIAQKMRFGNLDQIKLITAVSELTRNIVQYAGKGVLLIDMLKEQRKEGLQFTFIDHGPGICNLQLAMRDGYSTSGGLGLGLSGVKRLVDDFEIYSNSGEGTTVIIKKWVI